MMRWGSIRIRTGYIGPVVEVVVVIVFYPVRDRVAPGFHATFHARMISLISTSATRLPDIH